MCSWSVISGAGFTHAHTYTAGAQEHTLRLPVLAPHGPALGWGGRVGEDSTGPTPLLSSIPGCGGAGGGGGGPRAWQAPVGPSSRVISVVSNANETCPEP